MKEKSLYILIVRMVTAFGYLNSVTAAMEVQVLSFYKPTKGLRFAENVIYKKIHLSDCKNFKNDKKCM